MDCKENLYQNNSSVSFAGMNEKRQDSYAEEMISVLRTSGDEEEVLVRMQLCMQLISEGAVMEGGNGGQKSGTNDRAERENSKADGGRRTKPHKIL